MVLLEHGTHILNDVKRSTLFGFLVVFDIIGHPVFKDPETYRLVIGQGLVGIPL
jgi:hypothetical protein